MAYVRFSGGSDVYIYESYYGWVTHTTRDTETFVDDTPGACADRLEGFIKAGYLVPDGVVEDLRADQKEIEEKE